MSVHLDLYIFILHMNDTLVDRVEEIIAATF